MDNDGNIIGKVGGILLNSINTGEEEIVEEFVLAIEKLKNQTTNRLIIEDLNLFNMDNLRIIEEKTHLKINNGIKVLTFFMPYVLKEIYKVLNEDLKEKEVLIIGNDVELTKGMIETLYKDVGFITLAGNYEETIDDIYKYIMEKTGLSIFYSKNIDKILTNYSIIINLIDNHYLNMDKLRKKAIIFDCSISKGLKNQAAENSRIIIIEDFVFKIDHLNIMKNKYISSLIPSYVYEQFNRFEPDDFAGLSIREEFCNIDNFADYQMRRRGKL